MDVSGVRMISHLHRCIFTHVPKTAGKSILALFGLPEFGKDYTDPLQYIEDPYDHRPLSGYRDRPYFEDYLKFAFVRNPWDRVVSTFFYLDHGGCNQWDEMFRQRYLQPYAGDFKHFVREIDRVLATKHFLPQYLWLCDEQGRVLSDFVGRYEDLSTELSVIGKRLGIDVGGLPHLNRSQHERYDTYYDDETRERVARAYAADISVFGYTFDQRPVG